MSQEERVRIPVPDYTPLHSCAFPKSESGFLRHISWSFLCSVIWCEM